MQRHAGRTPCDDEVGVWSYAAASPETQISGKAPGAREWQESLLDRFQRDHGPTDILVFGLLGSRVRSQ